MTEQHKKDLTSCYNNILHLYGFAILVILKKRRVYEERFEEAKILFDILDEISDHNTPFLNSIEPTAAIKEWSFLLQKHSGVKESVAVNNLKEYLKLAEKLLHDIRLGCLRSEHLNLESLTEEINKLKK